MSFTAVVGQDHTFTVVAGGTPLLAYQWYFDNAPLALETNANLVLTNIQTNQVGAYLVVVTNEVAYATSLVATLTVRLPSDPKYAAPNGGWHYHYDGVGAAAAGNAALDGTWNHDNSSDSWSGDRRGAGDGLEGGLGSTNGVLSIEDAILSGTSSVDNRRYYLTHNLAQEPVVLNPSTLLDDGVTLSLRARLSPPPPADPLTELTNAPNGYVNVSDGKGMFGLRQSGGGGMIVSFSLHQALEDRTASGPFNFGQAGLHMNNLEGDTRSPNVDPGEDGTLNLLPLDPSLFQEFWINIQANGADPGTHRVSIYTNGNLTPVVFNVTGGTGSDTPANDYLALGLGSTFQRGAFDIDYFAYKSGLIAPVGFNVPVSITVPPATQYVGQSQPATFQVQVAGTPPYRFQWYRNGTPILNATNQTHTTAAAVPSDDGAAFAVVVQGNLNSVTSSPPATLEVVLPPTIVSQPQNQITTNAHPALFSVTATGEAILGYQWRFNQANLPGQTAATLSLASATPANAGTYDVTVFNPAGSVTSAPASLTVLGQDFGDAPDPLYPTFLLNNGARHLIAPGVTLGASVDLESNGQPNATATGDDVTGSADEDGVLFTGPVQAGQNAPVQVTASTSGFLDAWIDFQRDGSWAEAGDRIFTSRALSAGPNALSFSVPPSAAAGATLARFRFSSAGALGFAGPAADGEVEDHVVTIIPLTDLGLQNTDTPDPAATGTMLTYTVTVTNHGPSPATGVTVTNTLPSQLAFVSVFPSQGTCVENGGQVACSLGNLANGQPATITITGTTLLAGSLTNTTVVTGNELDPIPANNSLLAITKVMDAPAITSQPQSLTVTNGNTATFVVTATGTEPLHYQWLFNGLAMTDQTNNTLILAAALPSQEGAYTVSVSNAVHSILSQIAALTVLVPPSINVQPASQTALAGSDVTLAVQAAGTVPLNYQWYFNTATLLDGATGPSLLLTNVQTTLQGSYHVQISNSAGILNSSPASITVVEMDFGDAPNTGYPVTLASNGARHRLAPGIHLGTALDFEPEGLPTAAANGDDTTGADDEDGVRFLLPVLVGQTSSLEVVASVGGVLDGWVDFNLNGNWSDAADRIFSGRTVSAGTNLLTFTVPANATPGQAGARFRFSLAGVASFVGEAPNGEVEDYMVHIQPAVDLAVVQSAQPSPVAVGSNLVYSITVTNRGPSPASGVVTTNVLPSATTYIGATPSQGSCALDNGTVLCSLGVLNPATAATIQMTLVPSAAGILSNPINATSQETELNPLDNPSVLAVEAQIHPSITSQPQNLTVTNGSPAAFSVTASGTALQYQWRLNNANLPGQTSPLLSIPNSQPAHAGSYTVQITNAVGSVTSAPAVLTVLVPVTITAQPQNTTVIQGQSASVTVTAAGTEPLTYQWRFQGVPLPGATAPTLVIPSAQPSQAGSYQVEVSNATGPVLSSPALLTVLVPPAILVQPQSQTNLAGATVTLTVTASGTDPLNYRWLFNDTQELSSSPEPALTLANVQKSQSGFYSVVVSNAAGTNTSAQARLDILEVDFGDAPYPPYPSLLAYNGAHHHLIPGVFLGAAADFEPDAFAAPDATGDDTHGIDDEDGVVFESPLRIGQSSTLTVTASTGGFLDAWVDFNANGSWIDPGEKVFHAQPVITGANSLAITTPLDASLTATMARFRFGLTGGLSVDGYAANGEVEDYQVVLQPAVNLTVDRIIVPLPVVVSANLALDILITNLGPSTATQVKLTNDLPAGLTLINTAASQGGCTSSGGRIVCDLGQLEAGSHAVASFTAAAAQIGLMTNRVSVRSAEFDPNLGNNDATDIIPVVLPAAQFANPTSLALRDNGPAMIYPSTIVASGLTATVYKVTVTLSNLSHTFPDDFDVLLVGPGGQNVMLMSDALGNFFMNNVTITLDDAAAQGLPNSGAVVNGERYRPTDHGVTPDLLAPPAPAGPFGAALSVFAGTNPNGVWSLYAVDDFPEDFGLIGGGWSLRIQTIDPFADLAIAKLESPNPVAVGSNLFYTITVTNQGPNAASGVLVTDPLPPGLSAVGATASQGNCSLSANLIQCNLGTLNVNASVLINVQATANQIGLVTNTVSLTASQLDIIPQNNQASVVTSVTPVIDLAVSQSTSANPALLQSPVDLVIAVTNQGLNRATAVRLTGLSSPDATPLSLTPSQGSCTSLGQSYQCDLGELEIGSRASIVLRVQPTALGFLTNRAEITAAEVDGQGTNNLSELSLEVVPAANLALSGTTTPNPVVVTRSTTYALAVTNLGPSQATGVVLTCPLPATASLVSALSSQGDCLLNAGTVLCNLGALASGAGATATIEVTALASGFLSNIVSVAATQSDPDPANNALTLVTVVQPACDLALSVTDAPDPVVVSEPLTYQLAVSNLGPDAASSVVLRDPIPSGLTFLSFLASQGSCAPESGAIRCDLGLIASGGGAGVTLTFTPTLSGRVTNSFHVTANEVDLAPANNDATESTTVVVRHPALANVNPIVLGDQGPASLYPSTLLVSGLTAAVYKVSATLSNVHHRFPDDLDILLVGPRGQSAMLMSDAGGSTAVTNLTLTFDPTAPVSLQDTASLSGGTFRPTNFDPASDALADPAPAGPYASDLTVFAGTDPNGPWSLYVFDDRSPDAGGLGAGWSLQFTTLDPIADLALTQLAMPNPVGVSSNLTVTMTVTNQGPARAHQVVLAGTIPPQLGQVQASTTQGDCFILNGLISCNLGNLDAGALVKVILTAIVNAAGPIANLVTVQGLELDLIPANNSSSIAVLAEHPPVFVLQPQSQSVTNLSVVSFTSLATGAQPLVYQWQFNGADLPGATLPTLDLGAVTLANEGIYRVRAANHVGTALSAPAQLVVRVPPSLTPPANALTDEDIPAGPLPFVVDDLETPAGDLLVFGSSSNPALVPAGSFSFGGANGNRTVSVRPATNQFGTATITLTVRDSDGMEAAATFSLTVNPVNDAPSFVDIPNQVTNEDTPTGLIHFQVSDPETAPETVTLTKGSSNPTLVPPGNIIFAGSGADRTLTITPAPNLFGTATITVTATDPLNASRDETFVLTVVPINDAPTLNPIDGLTLDEDAPLQTIPLTGIGSGAPNENQFLNLSASSDNLALIANPVVIYSSPNPTATLFFVPNAQAYGSAVLTVSVNDGGSQNNPFTRQFTVTVRPVNDPPTIATINPQSTLEDSALSIPVTVGDLESALDSLIITGTASDTNFLPVANIQSTGTGATRNVILWPGTNQFGSATVTLTVTDENGAGASSQTSFVLTVLQVNDPPTLDPIADLSLLENSGEVDVPLTGIGSGATNEVQSLEVIVTSSNPALIPDPQVIYTTPDSTGLLRLAPAPDMIGTTFIRVTVDDGQPANALSIQTFVVSVLPLDTPPVISPIETQHMAEDTLSLSLPLTIFDLESPASTLAVSATSSNAQLVPDQNITLDGSGPNRTITLRPLPDQFGASTVTVTVTASNDVSSLMTFDVNVLPVNDPPTLDPIDDVVLAEDAAALVVPVTGIGSGAVNESQPFQLLASSSRPDLIPHPAVTYLSPEAAGTLTLTPAPNASGSATITVTVNDFGATDNLAVRSFLVTVNPSNEPPSLSPISNQTIKQNQTSRPIDFLVSDLETASDALTVTASSDNSSLIPNSNILLGGAGNGRTLSLTPLNNQTGTAVITVTLDDHDGGLTNTSFTLTVQAANAPPSIAGLADVTLNEDDAPQDLAFSVSDPESPAASLVPTASSSNPDLIPDSSLILSGSGTERTVTVAPVPNQSGSATITIEVSDESGGQTIDSFVVTVNPVNDPPTLAHIPNQTMSANTTLGLALTVGDIDSALDDLTLTGASSTQALVPNAGLVFSGTGAGRRLQITPAPDQLGSAQIALVVTDPGGAKATNSFQLTVLPPLVVVPVITSHPQSLAVSNGQPAFFSAAASGSQPMLFQWQFNGANLPGQTSPTLTLGSVQPSQAGNYRMIASNAAGSATSLVATLTVLLPPNPAGPALSAIAAQSTGEDTPITVPFTVGASDLEAFGVTLSATSSNPAVILNSGIVINGFGRNRTLTVTPALNRSGTTTISIFANNGAGVSTTAFTLTVTAVNDPPTLDQPANIARDKGPTSLDIPLTGIGSGAANETQTLSVSAVSSDPSIVSVQSLSYTSPNTTGTLALRPTSNATGPVTITITVDDSQLPNNTFSRSFLIHTKDAGNSAPTISTIVNRSTGEDTVIGPVSFTVGDVETPAGSLVLSAQSSNPALAPNGNISLGGSGANRTVTVTPLPNQTGTATITLLVLDTGFGASQTQFTITWNTVNDPPTVSTIASQAVDEDNASGLIVFSVGDVETPAGGLIATASSSNPGLLPDGNIILGGAGTNRAIKLTPLPNQSGLATVTLAVSDGSGGLTNRAFTLTVNPVNDLPLISSIADQSTAMNTATSPIAFTIGDLETAAANLTLAATSSNPALVSPANVIFGGTGANRTATVTPNADQSGFCLITLTVTDEGGASRDSIFGLFVSGNLANVAPTLDAVDDTVVDEDAGPQAVVLTGISTGSIAENQPLSVTALSDNTSLIPHPVINHTNGVATAVLTFQSLPDTHGSTTITVTVDDGQTANGLAVRTFNISVQPINDPPALSPLTDQIILINTVLGPLDLTLDDAESPAAGLLLSADSSNAALVPVANIALDGSGNARTVTVSPLPNQTGAATIIITAGDGTNTTTSSFNLSVGEANTPPTLSAMPDLVQDEDAIIAPLAFVIGDGESDPDNLALAAVSSNPSLLPNSAIVLGGAGAARTMALTLLPDAHGLSEITLLVTDQDGATAQETFLLTVNPMNDPPVLSGLADLALDEDALVGAIPMLVEDRETPSENLTLTGQSSNPALVSQASLVVDGTNQFRTLQFHLQPNQSGAAVITLIVTDADGASATNEFTLTVQPLNDPPSVSELADTSTPVGVATPAMAFAIGDAETSADALTVVATSSNPAVVPDANIQIDGGESNRTVTVTPDAIRAGTTVITITVTDGDGAATLETFLLVSDGFNSAPVISAIADQTTDRNVLLGPIAFTIGDTESPASALFLSAESSQPNLISPDNILFGGVGSNRTVTIQPSLNQLGEATITIMVTDPGGEFSSESFRVTVSQELVPNRITAITRTSGSASITFTTVNGLFYTVEFKDGLGPSSWSSLPAVNGTGNPVTVDDPAATPHTRVYRVRVE